MTERQDSLMPAVTPVAYVLKIPISNNGRDTRNRDVLRESPQTLQKNVRMAPKIMPQPLPCTKKCFQFVIH